VTHNISNLRIGYLPQKNMIDSNFPVVVRDVIKSGLLGVKGLSKDEQEKLYNETIEKVDLVEHADRPIGLLSGGQLQRALLGRAIIANPQLLVLDEPLSYIDKRFESRLYKLIEQLSKTTTIVLVSHEMSTIAGMANRHFIVDVNLHECTAHHHFIRTDCDN
jgi:zinc transport system ATP-binding protein